MLKDLTNARDKYERAFGVGGKADTPVERLSDRDLEFSGHVFVANGIGRRIQITVDNEGTPSAFIKKTGIDNEILLLQIIIKADNLQISTCKILFNSWIVKNLPQREIDDIVEQFGI